MQKNKLILASQSPRRNELLQMAFIPFDIIVSGIDEFSSETEMSQLVMDLSFQKAQAVYQKIKNDYAKPIVLGSDTIVVIGNEVLGKPKSREEAREMLKKLSGKRHEVLTGVALIDHTKEKRFYDRTYVTFETISDELLELYLDTKDSMDKAGSYGIQAQALSFIKKIEGSYSNVVGLPINLVLSELKDFVGATDGQWRNCFE